MTAAGTVPPEVWLAAGYCLLAVALAYVIDWLARRAATTAEGGSTARGFVYHPSHDAWTCPKDEWLWPESFDPAHRVLRYRANPTVCNACPVKHECTTSTTGREVQRAVDAWPASEAARFHRWIACTVALLGLVWPLATIASGVDSPSQVVLGGAVVVALLVSLPLWSHLRRSVVELPPGMAVRTLDDVVADRQAVELGITRRRARYASDSRPAERDPA